MEILNTLNLTQISGGTKLKQGDFGSVLSYSLADENRQEITSFDTKTAYINLVLDDKILFTTTTQVDISRVTFHIDKALPIGLYYLEIKIDDYVFPSDKDSIILIEEGATAYDLIDLIPNYDVNMTLDGIKSELATKTTQINTLNSQTNAIYTNAISDHAELQTAKDNFSSLDNRLDEQYKSLNTAITNLGNGSPKGSYSSLSALKTAYPTGTSGIYIATDSGHWYYYNAGWNDGGVYQAVSVGDDTVKYSHLTDEVKDSIAESKQIYNIINDLINTQVGQSVSKLYSNNQLVISSSGYGGGIPTFASNKGAMYESYEMIVGNAVASTAFIPIFAIQENSYYNGTSVTKYLCFRELNGNFVVKETYIDNSSQVQVYNVDLITITNTINQHISTDALIKIVNENGKVSLYINNVLALTYDLSQKPGFSFKGGIFLPGFTGNSSVIVAKNIRYYFNNFNVLNNKIKSIIATQSKSGKNENKIAHFSFDDVILVFNDITTNADVYTSVFENPFLAYLKNMHETYGMTVSLYCFYQDTTFNLSQCTNKFASEFTANSNWLKFGFHACDANINYTSTTADKAKSDYDKVIAELFRITGSLECIDRVVRLGNYQGNLASVIAFRDTSCGLKGLLTSTDVRTNYYLSDADNTYIYNHDRLYDAVNYMTFIKTSSLGSNWADFNKLSFANERENLETFLHEKDLTSGMKTYIENFCIFANQNKYEFNFMMNKI